MSSKKRSKQFLKGVSSYRVDQGLMPLVIREYLRSLDCPRALAVWLLYENKEHAQLANLSFDPKDYGNTVALANAYAATKFLSKFKKLNLDYDKETVAFEKFKSFELLCKHTNNRFRDLSADPLFKGPAVWLHNAVIRKIEWLLGDWSTEEFFRMPDWGPGASTLIRRANASSPRKFQSETGITRDLHALIPTDMIISAYPLWGVHLVRVGFPTYQVGNKVITVPKDASTDRVIAIEPGINLWFQLSVGEMISRRLSRVGIDLHDQSKNQALAKLGSKTSNLVTVDLSSASDSIAWRVVEALLPPRWYHVMDACRSHYGNIKGEQVRWEKFSSMGNGFTFALESLIFYAVATCCAEFVGAHGNVGTYGDDVILPTLAFDLFSTMMDFYGFRINWKKSHYDSPFRESCGAHFYGGVDVKPIYLKDSLSDLSSIYKLANAIRLLAFRRGANLCCDARFRHVHSRLVASIPSALRLRVPEPWGDAGLISNFDEASPARCGFGIEGYRVSGLMKARKSFRFEEQGYLLSQLWYLDKRTQTSLFKGDADEEGERLPFSGAPYMPETTNPLEYCPQKATGRNSVPAQREVFKLVVGMCRQWTDLGPWLDLG